MKVATPSTIEPPSKHKLSLSLNRPITTSTFSLIQLKLLRQGQRVFFSPKKYPVVIFVVYNQAMNMRLSSLSHADTYLHT